MLKLDERDGVAPNAVAGGPAVETRLGVAFVMVGSLGFVGGAVFGFIVVAIERPFYARYWLFIGLAVCSLALFGYTSGRYIHRYARRVRVDAAGVWTRSWSGTVYCAAWPEVEWVQLANSPQRAGVPIVLWLKRRDGQKFALPIRRGRLLPAHRRVLAEARARSVTIRPTRNG
jgi:hypothetical protein